MFGSLKNLDTMYVGGVIVMQRVSTKIYCNGYSTTVSTFNTYYGELKTT